jgi:hypothetical protein
LAHTYGIVYVVAIQLLYPTWRGIFFAAATSME